MADEEEDWSEAAGATQPPYIDANILAQELIRFFKTTPRLSDGQMYEVSDEMCMTYAESYGKTAEQFDNLNSQLRHTWGADVSHVLLQQQQQQISSSATTSAGQERRRHELEPPS